MYIREISMHDFTTFVNNNNLSTYRHSVNYAILKAENEYEYEFIAFGDNDNIYAAALVLVKLLNGYLYAYIPDGFLIDYENKDLLKQFTNALYTYYKKENIVFIKINPQIVIGEVNADNFETIYNNNYPISKSLEDCGFKYIEESNENNYIHHKINAIIDTTDFSLDKLKKNTKNKIRKAIRKGLEIEMGNQNNFDFLYKFTKNKINKNEFYYQDYYNIFQKNYQMDYFLVKINYENLIINSQCAYEDELNRNKYLNNQINIKNTRKCINAKINSDQALNAYKNDITTANKLINEYGNVANYIAAALVIKYRDTATIIISGYDKAYSDFAPNYFLYYKIIKYYHNKCKFVDLNGITKIDNNNKYHGLTQFKLGFCPNLYETIGEFDLIINTKIYNLLNKKGLLAKEYNNSNM